MAKISATYSEEIIDIVKNDTPFVALFNGDPQNGGTELSGAGYERKAVTFGAFSGGEVSNDAEIRWTNLPAGTINHIAIYNASTAGSLRVSGPTSSETGIESGDEYFMVAGNLTLSASGA